MRSPSFISIWRTAPNPDERENGWRRQPLICRRPTRFVRERSMDVGFIGLGNIGSAMARNLLKAGHRVTGFNRSRDKAEALAADGAKVAGSLAEAWRNPVVITMLAGDSDLERHRLWRLRRRQPLLRGHGRLHAPHRSRLRQANHAVGGDRREAQAAGGGQGQPVHPQPAVRPGRQAGESRRVLPRSQSRRAGHQGPVRRPRADPAGVSGPRRTSPRHGRAGTRRVPPVPDAWRRHGGVAGR